MTANVEDVTKKSLKLLFCGKVFFLAFFFFSLSILTWLKDRVEILVPV